MNALPADAFLVPDIPELDHALRTGAKPLPLLRRILQQGDAALNRYFTAGVSVGQLVHARAILVDAVLTRAFDVHLADAAGKLTLVAVGGYGRGELHPYSDVDIMILLHEQNRESQRTVIEKFIALLWDTGLAVSHSVRTLDECVREAQANVTVATNLMESRLLAGDMSLFSSMRNLTGPAKIWPSAMFFTAKWREQQQRHEKFHDTAYRLEPNVKEGPGGLRDIQMIGWVAQRHFDAETLHDLVHHGFLTESEYVTLMQGQIFLWKLRFALHMLSGRREDRLLFDAQLKLAHQFGYRDAPQSLAVEQFMQDYYRTIKQLGLLNEMLLQLLEEAILGTTAEATLLTDDFEARNDFLHAHDPKLFTRRPTALLELFHVLEQHPRLKGVGATTLRQLRHSLPLIDDRFRADAKNRGLFLQILREPRGVTHELRRMNRYGVLGCYLPAFGQIVGRMQYDLFHAYTVDEHTLFVISHLRRFALAHYDHEFPLCSQIMQRLPKPELAYLGALFHDIAKGRGGDHAELGAQEAEAFCLNHGLSRYDSHLVKWLVQHHLLLSLTAQKKDIGDPRVVHDFALQVGDQLHLDYLYVLTVADVRGTNPDLWNSWKASLFSELYRYAGQALRQGLESPIDKEELLHEVRESTLKLLRDQGMAAQDALAAWTLFSEEYFLQHTPDEIAWHTLNLAGCLGKGTPVVFLRQQMQRGGTAVCIYSSQDEFVFGRVTAALAQLEVTVIEARMVPMHNSDRLDTYIVLEDNGESILEAERLREIEQTLRHEIKRRNAAPITVTRRAPRQVRMFTTPTQVQFTDDPVNHRTVLEISAGDRPGLLSLIGQALRACDIRLQNAKITTVGERAEDVFFITDTQNRPLHDPAVRQRLYAALMACIGEAS